MKYSLLQKDAFNFKYISIKKLNSDKSKKIRCYKIHSPILPSNLLKLIK